MCRRLPISRCCRALFEHEGEVLAAGQGRGLQGDAPGADKFKRHLAREIGFRGVHQTILGGLDLGRSQSCACAAPAGELLAGVCPRECGVE
ncbi:hypothetical protein [Candidatus Skiveiella danica]|uniref:hypothetical protein n=1 Tax=Candidatus Skiveiella danica TaxID=3386177 RepID=UPI001DB45C94|nr:hypothetical protein [Betaproteobacteria bacterium]